MEFNDVHPDVIDAVNNMIPDDYDPKRRWVRFWSAMNERSALFAVGVLHGILSQEGNSTRNGNGNSNNDHQSTGLSLVYYEEDEHGFTEAAATVFCNFLQHTTTLSALCLCSFPPTQLPQLLHALRTNTSVRYLVLQNLDHEEDYEQVRGLLSHRNDLTALCVRHSWDIRIPHLLPFLEQGHAHLQILAIEGCKINDEGVRLLVQAFNRNKFKAMKKLSLCDNDLTSAGLRSLSTLDPDALPSLECLHLSGNAELLDDKESTQIFARNFLLLPSRILKELHVDSCGAGAVGYIIIIKSLETCKELRVLDISNFARDDKDCIRGQLIQSLPRMTGLQQLHVRRHFFDPDDVHQHFFNLDDARMMRALRQNVSLLNVTDGENERLATIMKRNKVLAKLDGMLGTTTTTHNTATNDNATTTPPPDGLWPRALYKAGQGSEGGSPVFQILRNRLATWVGPSSSTSDETNKHSHKEAESDSQQENNKRKVL